jgi:hypothetical protein
MHCAAGSAFAFTNPCNRPPKSARFFSSDNFTGTGAKSNTQKKIKKAVDKLFSNRLLFGLPLLQIRRIPVERR